MHSIIPTSPKGEPQTNMVDYILFEVWRDFVHKYGFKSVVTFENYLYIGMAEESSKFITETSNIRKRNWDVFFTSRQIFGLMKGVRGYFSSFWISDIELWFAWTLFLF